MQDAALTLFANTLLYSYQNTNFMSFLNDFFQTTPLPEGVKLTKTSSEIEVSVSTASIFLGIILSIFTLLYLLFAWGAPIFIVVKAIATESAVDFSNLFWSLLIMTPFIWSGKVLLKFTLKKLLGKVKVYITPSQCTIEAGLPIWKSRHQFRWKEVSQVEQQYGAISSGGSSRRRGRYGNSSRHTSSKSGSYGYTVITTRNDKSYDVNQDSVMQDKHQLFIHALLKYCFQELRYN